MAVNNHVSHRKILDDEYFWVDDCNFKIKLNKASEHDAKVTLKFLEPIDFNPLEEDEGTRDYLPDETELSDGVWTDDFYIAASNVELTLSQSAQLVLEYTKEDGSIGILESKTFNMYLGGYVYSEPEAGYENGILDINIPIIGVDVSEVKRKNYSLTLTPAGGDPITVTTLPEEDKSENFIILKYNVDLTSGTVYTYHIKADFTYTDSTGTIWDDTAEGEGNIYG